MTFITLRPDGVPVGRTLIIKDIDGDGYHFSTHRSSRKAWSSRRTRKHQ